MLGQAQPQPGSSAASSCVPPQRRLGHPAEEGEGSDYLHTFTEPTPSHSLWERKGKTSVRGKAKRPSGLLPRGRHKKHLSQEQGQPRVTKWVLDTMHAAPALHCFISSAPWA
jgi:hypothetical protein